MIAEKGKSPCSVATEARAQEKLLREDYNTSGEKNQPKEYLIKISQRGELSAKLSDFELENLQLGVGGYIETLTIWISGIDLPEEDRLLLICDEEGKLKGKPENRTATELSRRFPLDVIVGDVLIARAHGEHIRGFSANTALKLMETIAKLQMRLRLV